MSSPSSGPFRGSLAGVADTVRFEQEEAYAASWDEITPRVAVTLAAHGEMGSSIVAFRHVAQLLDALLHEPEASDDRVRELWGRARA
jgi:hypothetical protein